MTYPPRTARSVRRPRLRNVLSAWAVIATTCRPASNPFPAG